MMIRHCGIHIIPGKSQCSHSKSKENQMVVFPNSTNFHLSISSINHPIPPPLPMLSGLWKKTTSNDALIPKSHVVNHSGQKKYITFPVGRAILFATKINNPAPLHTFPTAIRVGHRMAKESLPPRYFGCPLACRGRAEKIAMAGRGLPVNVVSSINVGKTTINHPFGNGLYHLFMVIWGMVY